GTGAAGAALNPNIDNQLGTIICGSLPPTQTPTATPTEVARVDGPGLYNPANGAFLLRYANSNGLPDLSFSYGPGGASPQLIPLKGRYSAGFHDTVGLYNPANAKFLLINTNARIAPDISFVYGRANAGLIPLMGDWNGDGIDTAGLYNPANAAFLLRNSNSAGGVDSSFIYGPGGSDFTPLAGDWNGDGFDTI